MDNAQSQHEPTIKKNLRSWFSLETLPTYLYVGLVALLPLFFIPIPGVSLQFSKYLLFALVVLVTGGIWILQRLKDGVIELPVNVLTLSGLGVLGIMILSALFGNNIYGSFVGQSTDIDTVLFMFISFLLLLFIPAFFKEKKKIIWVYMAFFASLLALSLFHLARLAFGITPIGAGVLSLGILNYTTDSLIGKWNDLAIFFGLGAMLSLMTLESLPLKSVMKSILYVALAVSVFFLAVINFSMIWYILGLLSLILFVYGVVMNRVNSKGNRTSLPIASCAILIISVIFIYAGPQIGAYLQSALNVSQIEFQPNLRETTQVAREVILQKSFVKPFFGVGPNHFDSAWYMYKPAGVNDGIFWNTAFNYGVGIIPSSLVTTGVLGFLSWAIFLALLVYMGFRSILSKISDSTSQYLVTSSFIGALYLWIFAVIYLPGLPLLALAFFFTGLFIASLTISGILHPISVPYFKNVKIGFVSVLALVVLLILGIGLCYVFMTKLVAAVYYQQGVRAVTAGEFDRGENLLVRSHNFNPTDSTARTLAQVSMLHLSTVLNNASTTKEFAAQEFQRLSDAAIRASNAAIAYDDTNDQNWMTRGDVASALVPFQYKDAYKGAFEAYENAKKYNPHNPLVYLQMARLELANKNVDQSKDYIKKAVSLKGNYSDAYMMLAQIQVSQGDMKGAIASAASSTAFNVNNPGSHFYLGLLYYNEKMYAEAAASFERAVILNNAYADARYALALAYYELDRSKDAITQLEIVQQLNPGVDQLKTMISNLKAGRAPLNTNKAVDPNLDTATSTPKKSTKK